MKIVCTRDNLINSLSLIGGIATKSVNLPILNNVLFRIEQQKVSLIATNLELAIIVQLRAKVEKEGSFTVPAKTLTEFVNLLSDETVELEVKENELEVSCGKSSTKIKGTSAEDFPVLPNISEGVGYLLNRDVLKKGLDQVNSSAAKNDIRPELAAILFSFNPEGHKGLVLAATDSYRLAEKKITLEQGEDQNRVIVPARTAIETNRVLTINKNNGESEKTVRVTVSDSQIVIRNNDVELISRLVEGKYPDYTQIIPTNFKTEMELDISNLTKDVKAAGLFTTLGVNAVTFKIKSDENIVAISSASSQAGEHQTQISTEIKGEDNEIILNHRYILEGLSNIDTEKCVFKIVNGDSPCVISSSSDDNYVYIVMPIRQ